MLGPREKLAILRGKAYRALGNVCECCLEQNDAFLQIGHRHDDGAIMRRLGKNESSHHLYRAVLKMANPKSIYRLECANCNQAKRRIGRCPHEV